MKVLSIIVPTFNTELYLSRCLDSLTYDESVLDKLEVIVVNDGSVDDSVNVAKQYAKRFPECIRIINKENGGHGSAVNAGVKDATGKYLRIVDSDDWVNIDDFGEFINALADMDEDIVITNYQEDLLYNQSVLKFNFTEKLPPNKPHKLGSLTKIIDQPDFFFVFSMHSMTVRLDVLRKVWDNGLLEKTFYVDQQYVAKVLECAKSFRLTKFDIYRYFIGRAEQSVGAEGFFKHRKDHERVLRWLIKQCQNECLNEACKVALRKQLDLMLETHYDIYYRNIFAKQTEINEIIGFDDYLHSALPDIEERVDAAKQLRRRLSPLRRKVKQLLKGD